MTREEIKLLLYSNGITEALNQNIFNAIVNAMVECYNKAIDDAKGRINVADISDSLVKIEQLKIK